MARVEELKKLSILDVAEALGMELKRQGTDRYVWVEHESFVISPRRNIFSWFSRDVKGDVIKLVQTIREEQTGTRPSFKTAKHFLEVGEFLEVDMSAAPEPKLAFEYRHERYEHTNPSWTKDYLRRERKLSEDTITFFFQQGNIAEISHKMNDYSEPAIVFKFKNSQGKVMGASLQGIVENREKYPDRGYLKRILKNSDGLTGFYADVGRPKRLIFAESPIDLMSYYQLHRNQLQDVRLVAMDGLKEGLMSYRFAELISELQGKIYEPGERTAKVLEATAQTSTFFQKEGNQDFITLAVDNDSAGHKFISRLQDKGIPFKLDIPPIAQEGLEKADWNSFLKNPLQEAADLFHVYSYDLKEKTAAYQGYFSKEIADQKADQLTAGDVVAFSTPETLSIDEIKEQHKIMINYQDEVLRDRDNSRLAQARRKLERLKGELDTSIQATYDHQSLTNGQPMNDKKGGDRFFRRQEQLESRIFAKMDEIKQQEERIEQLEWREENKRLGLNRQGTGLEMSVKNIPRIREEIEKASKGESTYTAATIRRYKQELVKLEAIQEKTAGLTIQPGAQALIDAEEVNQWQKRPNTYFVKGLRRVALELNEDGNFEMSSNPRYQPKTEEDQLKVTELLDRQRLNKTTSEIKPLEVQDPEKKYDTTKEENMAEENLERITSVKRGNTEYGNVASLIEELRKDLEDPFNLEASEAMEDLLKSNPSLEQLLVGYADTFVLGDVSVNGYPLVTDEVYHFGALSTDGEYLDLEKYKVSVEKNQKNVDVPALDPGPQEEKKPSPDNQRTVEQFIQERDLNGLSAHLKEGVRDYFNSDTYKAFLNTMSKLNNYSLNNLFLIMAQQKDVSAVASFNAWKKLGRHVKKGSKALKVWAPYQVTKKDEKGQPVLDKKGNEVKVTRFRLVPVFDVSQTEGKELARPIYNLEGTHQDYANLYRAAKETAEAKGVRFEISKEDMKANGYYNLNDNKIVIKAGMSEQQTLRTIFHEMAHSDLHNPKALEGQQLTRTNAELQAESVAYVVANHYGMDTSSYSFAYLANWSKEPDSLADLEAQLAVVQQEAKDLIQRLDTAFEKYQSKEVSKDPLSQKLEEFNQKCQKKLKEKEASEPTKKADPQKGDEEKDQQTSK